MTRHPSDPPKPLGASSTPFPRSSFTVTVVGSSPAPCLLSRVKAVLRDSVDKAKLQMQIAVVDVWAVCETRLDFQCLFHLWKGNFAHLKSEKTQSLKHFSLPPCPSEGLETLALRRLLTSVSCHF